MATDIQGSIGTTVKIGLGKPTAWDATSVDTFEATTDLVGFVETISEYGGTGTVETFAALADGILRKAIGVFDYGQATVALGKVSEDVGQVALKDAFDGANARAQHTAIVTYPDGTREAFAVLVSSFTRNPGAAGPFIRANVNLELDSKVYELVANAGP